MQVLQPANQVRSGVASADGVLCQEPLQRGCVGILKRRDVLVEERTGPRRGRLSDLAGDRGHFLQPGTGALQRALDQRRRGAEHDGDIGGGEREDVTQDQRRPLPRRQVLQAGDER